jgi:hypothetical protein
MEPYFIQDSFREQKLKIKEEFQDIWLINVQLHAELINLQSSLQIDLEKK